MGNQLPEDFRCPISLEIMSDPVILSSGHTFDRSSIQRWLDAGHRSCPITKLPLSEPPVLIPNHALRSLISHFTSSSAAAQSQVCARTPPQPVFIGPDPEILINTILSVTSPPESKLYCLDQLVKISKHDVATRRRLTESGAALTILNRVEPGSDPVWEEKAMGLLLNLSLDDDNKVGLVAEGVLGKVVLALHGGACDSRAVAATVLTSLAVVEVNKATIGAYPDAISGLIRLLRVGTGRERKEAATALFTLCSFHGNRVRAVENGAVAVVVDNACSGMERAVEVLGLLAKCKEGREEIARVEGLSRILVGLIKSGSVSARTVQYALLTLSLLCSYREKMRMECIREGAFQISVALLEDDNEKVRRNANSLIQVLQCGKRR